MKLTESSLRQLIRQAIREAEPEGDEESGRINMDDPVMQKTGWWKDNPELTVGGVLKQGEDHPAHDAAKKEVEKEKGKGQEDKPEPKQTKIAADPFADKEAKPKAEPEEKPAGDDLELPEPPKKGVRHATGDSSTQINNYLQHLEGGGSLSDEDGEHLKDVFSDVMHKKYGVVTRDGKFGTEDYDEETDDVTFKPLDDERANELIGKATQRTSNEIGFIRDKIGKKEESIISKLKEEFKQYGFTKKTKNWKQIVI